jgi:hypothetical protein
VSVVGDTFGAADRLPAAGALALDDPLAWAGLDLLDVLADTFMADREARFVGRGVGAFGAEDVPFGGTNMAGESDSSSTAVVFTLPVNRSDVRGSIESGPDLIRLLLAAEEESFVGQTSVAARLFSRKLPEPGVAKKSSNPLIYLGRCGDSVFSGMGGAFFAGPDGSVCSDADASVFSGPARASLGESSFRRVVPLDLSLVLSAMPTAVDGCFFP